MAALAYSALFMDGLSYARSVGLSAPLPLLVIAAGNFGSSADAWYGGLPTLRDSLGDTVLVVGASTKTWTQASFSPSNTTHHYIQIMAPGQTLWGLNRNNSLDSTSGTSFATPYVTGVGGMLLAFDPRIGAPTPGFGPPELKRVILAGADSSRNPVTGLPHTAGGIRFLDAYEALREAARRPGAPVCRNRIWIDGRRVIVERTPSVKDTIYTGPNELWNLRTFHGGQRLDFVDYVTGDSSRSLYQAAGHWTIGTRGPDTEYTRSGSAYSFNSLSHNADTLATTEFTSDWHFDGTGGHIAIGLRDTSGVTLYKTLGTIPHHVYSVSSRAYSPRGDGIYVATQGNQYNGIEVWKYLMDGSTPSVLWSIPNGAAARMGVSEDGYEIVADIEYNVGLPTYALSCYTEYRSARTGIRLDSVSTIADPSDCSVYRKGAQSARRVATLP